MPMSTSCNVCACPALLWKQEEVVEEEEVELEEEKVEEEKVEEEKVEEEKEIVF